MTEVNVRWHLFLNDLAVKVELTAGEIEVFTYQFDSQREHQSNTEIKKSIFADKNIGGDNHKRIIGNVYAKLSNLGVDYGNATAERIDVVWQWLKQEYPQWEERLLGRSKLGVEALWTQLKELGKYAPERMGAYIAENEVQKAGALKNPQPNSFLQAVPQGIDGLKFKIVSEGMGQVLLLNYDDAKVVYCVCPSTQAPSINVNRGEMSIPQPESPYAYLGAEPGKEEWWGWIVPQMPILSWLEEARDRVLQLNAVQLAELLTQVELHQGEVLHTFYRVG